MSYKNTCIIKAPGQVEYTLHFTERISNIQVEVYPFGNPSKRETIGYYNKAMSWLEPVGRLSEWSNAKIIALCVLRHLSGINQLYYKCLTIRPLGKMTIPMLKPLIQEVQK